MNMQHARVATSLMGEDILGAEAQTVIALIQEPYVGKGGVPLGFLGGVKVLLRGKEIKSSDRHKRDRFTALPIFFR